MGSKNKWLKFSVIFFLAYSNLSMNFYNSILTEEDFEMAHRDRDHGPALAKSLDEKPYWESYNEWRCFDRDTVELTCAELQHENGSFNAYVALMSILVDGYLFEYYPLLETKQDCFPVAFQWFDLMQNEKEVCIYGAHLNDTQPFIDGVPSDGSIWYVNQIKTYRGYWKTWEDENYLSDDGTSEE